MKRLAFIIGLFATGFAVAQQDFTIENHRNNGTYSYFVCDSIIPDLMDITGNTVSWDYSSIGKIEGVMNEIKIAALDGTEDEVFFGADRSVYIEGLITEFIIDGSSNVTRKGIEIIHPDLQTVNAYFDPAPITITYPFSYGDEISSSFNGGADVVLAGMENVPMFGSHKTIYDGFGTLEVGNTTIHNVSRLHIYDSIKVDTQDPDVGIIDVVLRVFEYYNLNISSVPIFVRGSYDIILDPTFPVVVPIVLSKYDPSITQVIDDEASVKVNKEIAFKVFPNPAIDFITISGEFTKADIMIFDQTGRIVKEENVSKGGIIAIDELETGIYFVSTTINGRTISKKIAKK